MKSSDLNDMVGRLIEEGGSDLHLKATSPPAIRVRGLLVHVEGYDALSPEDTEGILKSKIPHDLFDEFGREGEAVFY